ncbi:MAG: tetratricopeptide repeat protein [Treponema sp.]|nr:tetratricopeptide repeat protein [Treponema sp.]
MKKLNLKKSVKAFLKIFFASSVCTIVTAQSASDVKLFGELNSAFQSGSYPAVIELSCQMENQFPRSLLLGKSYSLKGQSFFYLGRYSDGVEALEKVAALSASDVEVKIKSFYWLGKCYASLEKYSEGINAFFNSCKIYKDYGSAYLARINYLSLKSCGECYFKTGDYKNAVYLLENCIAEGNNFNQTEYNSILTLLFEAYNLSGNSKRLIALYKNLKQENFDWSVYGTLALSAGEAYENLGEYKNAYSEYVKVLNGQDSILASIALQKAYVTASAHKKEVGQNPGSVLEKAKDTLNEYNLLLAEFWTRLAIDSFYEKDFASAETYFSNAEKNDESGIYSSLIGLYKAQISPSKAKEILDAYSEKYSIDENSRYYADYLCAYGKYYAAEKDFDKTIECCEKALPLISGDNSKKEELKSLLYFYAMALYEKGQVEKACTLLKDQPLTQKGEKLLFARILAKKGNVEEARKIYESQELSLSQGELADYSKLLFLDGALTSSYSVASSVKNPQGYYMTALSSFNRKNWAEADSYFSKYIASGEKDYLDYALFYSGYAQYKSGRCLTAYSTLSEFTSKYPSHQLSWNAYVIASNCSVQNGSYQQAALQAEKALAISSNKEQTEAAVLLCAAVYSDSNENDKAVKVLSPSAKEKSDFGVRCRYLIAQIYGKEGKLTESDRAYAEIQNNFSSNPLSDEASYRRGELYYTKQIYEVAVQRFLEYQKKFPKGKFVDASYFYLADSYSKASQKNKAENSYRLLLQLFPESPYVYGARKNLVELYKSQGDYEKAYNEAVTLINDFPAESKSEGMENQLQELKRLTSGKDSTIVKLEIQYENNGGSSTLEGRITGTELCELKWKDVTMQEEAAALAMELFYLQRKNSSESQYAAHTGIIAAEYCRLNEDNEKAAELYLETAKFARESGQHIFAQRSLYSAVETFIALDKTGDARQTAAFLSEIYPDSSYDVQSKKLLESVN